MDKKMKYLTLLLILLAIDLVSKLIVEHLQIYTAGFISIQLFENFEVYFDLIAGSYAAILSFCFKTVILILITIKVINADDNKTLKLGLVLMLSGNLGNLINAIVWHGKVVDWIVIGDYIAFNFADFYMLIGLSLIAIQLVRWLFAGELMKKLRGIIKI